MKFLEFDKTRDFPFYRHNPHLSNESWLILLLSVPLAFLVYVFLSSFTSELVGSVYFMLIMLIPLLYFSNWNYKLFIQKPTKNEIILGVLMFIGYMIYSIIIENLLVNLGIVYPAGANPLNIDYISLISLIFSMMGEELIKFIPLMFFLRLFYKVTENRNLSFALSSIIIMIGFGLLHYDFTSSVISVLLLQGLGTSFELYGYFKTKNIFVSYLSHILTDATVFILILSGL
ncbi:hypothetical protein [uncultured Methanobrevibacter sp.]|uniref:hypothetical protein n=1 Tax=uncultured Methanobrevibacter sp. TaxID=253161 RepID=UPI0025D11771|nr:hypothetical protein [uncultured Methanobrevibacter sp.]